MKKAISVLLMAALASGCASAAVEPQDEKTASDMSGYATLTDTDHVFYDMSVKQMAQAMDDGETFVVYFGFETCSWCLEAVPLLNETAKQYDTQVGYINTRANEEWTSNLDIDDYDLVVEKLGDHLEYDNDGIKHLYTPHVFFIKEGKVVFDHEGTIEGHNAKEESLSEEEKDTVRDYYKEGFEALK